MNSLIKQDNLLFEETVRLTEVREYGFSWREFGQAKRPLPPSGIRFDIHFEGEVKGDDLRGTIRGVDYLTVRSDGRLFLQLHASIATHDGAMIYVSESGINDNGKLQLNMDFHTNDNRYIWLNGKHVWGLGTVDFETGNVFIKAYHNRN